MEEWEGVAFTAHGYLFSVTVDLCEKQRNVPCVSY